MMRRLLCGALGICVCAAVLLARPGVIKTKDGRTLEGEVREGSETVAVTIRGIETIFNRADVASVEYRPTAESAGGQKSSQENRSVSTPAGETSTATGGAKAPANVHLLTPAQINVIRQMEVTATDTNLRVRFENNVQNIFLDSKGMDKSEKEKFRKMKPVEQAMKILEDNNPKLIVDVKIAGDPASVREYRTKVHRTVMTGCASMNCHGGTGGGNLVLLPSAEGDAGIYTNFYILQKYAKAVAGASSGVFGGGGVRYLINRAQPEQSLLLQYGLPASMVEFRHPDVQGYRPIFSSRNDPRYKQVQNWISGTLKSVQPEYNLDYALPGGTSATRPGATP